MLYTALRVDAVPLGFQLLLTCVADTCDIETESQNSQHHIALGRFAMSPSAMLPIPPAMLPVTSMRDLHRSKQWGGRDIEMSMPIEYANVPQQLFNSDPLLEIMIIDSSVLRNLTLKLRPKQFSIKLIGQGSTVRPGRQVVQICTLESFLDQ